MRLRITIAMLETRNRKTLQSKVNICKSDVKIGDYADSLVLRWHLVKFNTTVAVYFSNSTCISTLPFIYALTVNLQKILYNSQTSVGGRQYTIILFISITFLPTILIYLNDREGAPLSFVAF